MRNVSRLRISLPQIPVSHMLVVPEEILKGSAEYWAMEVLTTIYNEVNKLFGIKASDLHRVFETKDGYNMLFQGLGILENRGYIRNDKGFLFPTRKLLIAYLVPDTLFEVEIEVA